MKKLWLLSLIIGIAALLPSSAKAVGLNDFRITNYEINYDLSRDNENRSVLKTTEKITANFTNKDINRGIYRYIPNKYDGHLVNLKIESITDENLNPIKYSKSNEYNNTYIKIGDPNSYVNGLKTYIITYSQRDVTKSYSDIGFDEWYWDTNGVDWRVPIDKLTVTATFENSVKSNLKQYACYVGINSSTSRCEIKEEGNTYTVVAEDLQPYENVTTAYGFSSGTFANYKLSLKDFFQIALPRIIGLNILLGFIIVYALTFFYRYIAKRKSERKVIVTQFLPPKDASVLIAASTSSNAYNLFTAQILDLAIRKYIKIYQKKESGFFTSAVYEFEIVKKISDLHEEEIEFVTDLFGPDPAIGSRFSTSQLASRSIKERLGDNDKKFKKLISDKYGLRQKVKDNQDSRVTTYKLLRTYINIGKAFIIISILSIGTLFILLLIGIIILISSKKIEPLTDKGLELAKYLDGLKKYIKVAEKDRISMLQTPEAVSQIGRFDVNNKEKLIELYEKLLPYAVIFGLDYTWGKELEHLYKDADHSPVWIYSSTGNLFSPSEFSGVLNNMSSSSSLSSASGGSGGGGSSGGGGGGGGGGGW